MMCLFLFSSRRRHTRWTGDWSSDVCSSDLGGGGRLEVARRVQAEQPEEPLQVLGQLLVGQREGGGEGTPVDRQLGQPPIGARSEERRVGKECRERGGREQREKNRIDDNVWT